MKKSKIAIFGTGGYGRKAYAYFGKEKTGLFIDNDKAKQGSELFGVKVISFEEFLTVAADYDLIIGIRDHEEVLRQVLAAGVKECWTFYMPWNHAMFYKIRKRYYEKDYKAERYEELQQRMSREKAKDYAENEKWDICLTGLVTEANYGAQLTYFSLYSYLNKLGYTVLMNQPPLTAKVTPWRFPRLFKGESYLPYDMSPIYDTIDDMKKLNGKARIFMLGSDQMWNMELMEERAYISNMDFVAQDKKLIAYATSFGKGEWEGTEDEKKRLLKAIGKFTAVSVRERSGVGICEEVFGKKAVHCVDPVFFNCIDFYQELMNRAECKIENNTLTTYIFRNTDTYRQEIHKHAAENNYTCNEMLPNDGYIADWLYQIKNSKLLITNSYHAMCFAVIFRVNFVVIRFHWMERMEDFLRLIGLSGRIIDSIEEINQRKDLLADIDYDAVWEKLQIHIDHSKKWLSQQLESI